MLPPGGCFVIQIRVTPTEDILEKLGREVDKMLLKALIRA
jgi:hypothetical protein